MSDRSVRELIQYLAGTHDNNNIFIIDAEVTSVDKNNRTCECVSIGGNTGNTFPDVRLMSSIDDGELKIPTVGSVVVIILTTFTEPFIACYGELDSIILRGGDLGGMVKVEDTVNRFNKIEKLLNDLILKYNSHTHNVTSVGSPTGPNLVQENQTAILTVRKDIENENITQG